MRRDHFTLAVEDADPRGSDPPSLAVRYDGPVGELTAHLTADGTLPSGEDVDAAFRRVAADDEAGVFSLTRRLTGEFLLEANADADAIQSLVDAARDRSGAYRIRIDRPEAGEVVLETETLLVYDPDGNLLRKDSLIPSGVEL
jgi:hypothetical protein